MENFLFPGLWSFIGIWSLTELVSVIHVSSGIVIFALRALRQAGDWICCVQYDVSIHPWHAAMKFSSIKYEVTTTT